MCLSTHILFGLYGAGIAYSRPLLKTSLGLAKYLLLSSYPELTVNNKVQPNPMRTDEEAGAHGKA